ncbi:hypothetical protein COCCADRAFT_152 [Bipolaris zeicola 26-R-13]|uniref:Nucleoside phosphorylase domain-containing protein n=1 Tax=Cochliobolus carbonum (strain 26-R-13) TaxID=930089 RepID=W6YJ76_COCC2|nr:uncharacterized protein COCCADRAFT_152 [Bipolaris zeicola 26-R-13]EUC39412.1 hypothetical protein COCCADRAFT_152 [Bipolaris zeicola 26-R-13]
MARLLRPEDYTVAWLCMLPIELAAAHEMLDEVHQDLEHESNDDKNLYLLGSIAGHNIAIMCLPAEHIGNSSAAVMATQMMVTFKRIRFGLMVGIGGGVPNADADIRLGDVVVSQPDKTCGGVVQYDAGKTTASGFVRTGSLNAPPQVLLRAVVRARTMMLRGRSKVFEHIAKLERLPQFRYMKTGPDVLFEATYDHEGGKTCDMCSMDRQEARPPRHSEEGIVVHYGTIASGNQIIKNAAERDRASAELGGVLCFEMEAAGLSRSFPCLVIRGICDYADSHKNKQWQAYAAGTAAAYTKEILSVISPAEVAMSRMVEEAVKAEGLLDDVTEGDLQPPSLKHSFAQASTLPITVSQTYDFSDMIWSSTGKDSEIVTDAMNHATQDSALNEPNEEQKISPPELSSAKTVYAPSATLTTPALRGKGYTGKLAEQLFGVVNCTDLTRDALDHLSQSLPDLLRAFAVKVGYQASSPMHRDVMFYVRRDRVSVQQAFQCLIDDVLQPEEPVKFDEGLGRDAIDRFMKDTEEFEDVPEQQIDAEAAGPEQDEKQQDESQEQSKIFDFILQIRAYKWLVDTLRRETILKRASPDLMEQIGARIRGVLLSYGDKVSRKTPSQEYEATFELLWNPPHYLKDQRPHDDAEEVLGDTITLTGTVNDAQALTALEYLCQVWPDSGMHVMQLITDIVCQDSEHIATTSLLDGTQFQARIEDAKLIVNVVGSSESLAEAGQQLAWLGAALQSPPIETGIALCVPFIRECYLMHDPPPVEVSEQRQRGKIFCRFDSEVKAPYMAGIEGSGLCWHKMFASPILVGGFPILSKPEPKLGLEMSLDLLAGMVGAPQVLGIQGKVFLKGFSTMLVGVRRLDDLLIWHFSFDEEGNRISYLDVPLGQACNMSVDQINDVRHVVGWSRKSSYYAGAEDADYDIKGTDLPPPRAGALLEKFTFNLGKVFTAGATIAPRKYVVLWDEETKRGWLVNGTSALLHLVRMSLKVYKKDYSQELLFDESMMQNEAEHDAASARKVLKNERNRYLEVWCGKSENATGAEQKLPVQNQPSVARKTNKSKYTFETLVEQKWSVLEVLMESHKQLAGLNGINLKFRIRRHLEGWNFEDLAGESDPEPRVATLKAVGYGWVDFVHSLKAITLFGRGFGNIIRPSKCERICSQWSQLPKGEYHLAASLHDLDVIMSKTRKTERGDIEIVRGLLWHSPIDPFTPCRCLSRGQMEEPHKLCVEGHDPVQALFPKALIKGSMLFPSPRKPETLNNNGAVVFGHTMSWTSNHRMAHIGGVSSEEHCSPDHSDPQRTVLKADTPMTSLALNQSYPGQLGRTYGELAYTLRSVDISKMTPEQYTIRHADTLIANRQHDTTDTSEEEIEELEDSWGKMWWETSQLSRCGPKRATAPESRN